MALWTTGDVITATKLNIMYHEMMFGDGSDGDVTISVDTVLTSDKFYDNLTINAGVSLNTDGYRVFVSHTLTVNGTIHCNGNNGSGLTAGAARVAHSFGASGAGGNGGTDSGAIGGGGGGGGGIVFISAETVIISATGIISANGGNGGNANNTISGSTNNGTNGSSISDSYGGAAGAGGNGGVGVAGTGGTATQTVTKIPRNFIVAAKDVYTGGGGGGGGSVAHFDTTIYNGGGGGGGGGVVVINTLVYTNSGTVSATGGTKGTNGGSSGTTATDGSDGHTIILN